jgi:hypothetical protein
MRPVFLSKIYGAARPGVHIENTPLMHSPGPKP